MVEAAGPSTMIGKKRARKVTSDLMDLSRFFNSKDDPTITKRQKVQDASLGDYNCPYLG